MRGGMLFELGERTKTGECRCLGGFCPVTLELCVLWFCFFEAEVQLIRRPSHVQYSGDEQMGGVMPRGKCSYSGHEDEA